MDFLFTQEAAAVAVLEGQGEPLQVRHLLVVGLVGLD